MRICVGISLMSALLVGANADAEMVGAHMYNYATQRNLLATGDVAGVAPQANWNNCDRFGDENLMNSVGGATAVDYSFIRSGENNSNPDGQMVHNEVGSVGSNNQKLAADTPYCTSQPTLWWINDLLTVNGGNNDILFYSRNTGVQYSCDNSTWENFTWKTFEDISVACVAGWTYDEMYLRLPDNGPAFTAMQVKPHVSPPPAGAVIVVR